MIDRVHQRIQKCDSALCLWNLSVCPLSWSWPPSSCPLSSASRVAAEWRRGHPALPPAAAGWSRGAVRGRKRRSECVSVWSAYAAAILVSHDWLFIWAKVNLKRNSTYFLMPKDQASYSTCVNSTVKVSFFLFLAGRITTLLCCQVFYIYIYMASHLLYLPVIDLTLKTSTTACSGRFPLTQNNLFSIKTEAHWLSFGNFTAFHCQTEQVQ